MQYSIVGDHHDNEKISLFSGQVLVDARELQGLEKRDILCDGLPKVPGGRLGDMLGTKKVFGLAM